MQVPQEDHSFEQVLNFRDVGNTVNAFVGKSTLKPGLFYRSARPDDTSQADRTYISQDLGIRTIVDLRSKTEHINAAKKHSSRASPTIHDSAAVPQSNDSISLPLQISGITYAEINLNGGSFERALLWQLKYSSFARLVWLMALGYREDAISILGREVMQKRGLIGLGIDTLDHSGTEIRDVFEVLAGKENYPVMVHCTQGKDRTGLIVLLVLMLCGVSTDVIADDYMRSEKELEPEKEERIREIIRIGLNEEFAGCPRNFVNEVARHMQEQHRGIEEYLTRIGVNEESQQRIRSILMNEFSTS
jgi:protein-tyrosine phosphatase